MPFNSYFPQLMEAYTHHILWWDSKKISIWQPCYVCTYNDSYTGCYLFVFFGAVLDLTPYHLHFLFILLIDKINLCPTFKFYVKGV